MRSSVLTTDQEIAQAITTACQDDPRLVHLYPKMEADHGVVTLTDARSLRRGPGDGQPARLLGSQLSSWGDYAPAELGELYGLGRALASRGIAQSISQKKRTPLSVRAWRQAADPPSDLSLTRPGFCRPGSESPAGRCGAQGRREGGKVVQKLP
jgi:hypothetical protein